MVGLVVRVLLLCTVVFAVVYAITRALKAMSTSKEAQRIVDEVRALRSAVERGTIDPADYATAADRIRRDCAHLGIPVPEIPPHLPPRNSKDT